MEAPQNGIKIIFMTRYTVQKCCKKETSNRKKVGQFHEREHPQNPIKSHHRTTTPIDTTSHILDRSSKS